MTNQPPPDSDPIESRSDSNGSDIIVSPPRVARRARWAAVAFLLTLSVYAVLILLAHRYAYFDWDLSLGRSIQSISVPGFGMLMIGVSFLGGWIAWPLVVATGLALVKKGPRGLFHRVFWVPLFSSVRVAQARPLAHGIADRAGSPEYACWGLAGISGRSLAQRCTGCVPCGWDLADANDRDLSPDQSEECALERW